MPSKVLQPAVLLPTPNQTENQTCMNKKARQESTTMLPLWVNTHYTPRFYGDALSPAGLAQAEVNGLPVVRNGKKSERQSTHIHAHTPLLAQLSLIPRPGCLALEACEHRSHLCPQEGDVGENCKPALVQHLSSPLPHSPFTHPSHTSPNIPIWAHQKRPPPP